MKIKTIACDMDNSIIYISEHLWRNPKHAIRSGRLKYLGHLGWYPDQEHKALFEKLDKEFDISSLYPGEYIEVDFETK